MDEFVKKYPYCGGEEFQLTYQGGYAALSVPGHPLLGSSICHTVCLGCGSIVRSFVKEPRRLLPKDRRKTKV